MRQKQKIERDLQVIQIFQLAFMDFKNDYYVEGKKQ